LRATLAMSSFFSAVDDWSRAAVTLARMAARIDK
jgi:hypothetical protein